MLKNQLVIRTERDRARAVNIISRIPLERPLLVTVDDYHERRSNDQNARLWALHSLAASVVGISPSEMHEEALCNFYGYREVTVVDPKGETHHRRVPLERSRLQDKKRFREFMDATEAWYIEWLGVFLP